MNKLKYITILRGIAILLVLVVHVGTSGTGLNYLHPYIISAFYNGARGVQLFYLLSAFTLFISFNNRRSKETQPITKYFIRRFFRIAPLYYLAIIYYLWQDGRGPRYWLGNSPNISTGNIVSNFFFVHGISPYWITSLVPGGWSVAVEVLFYCLLPFLFYRFKNIKDACNFTLIALIFRILLLMFLPRVVHIEDQQLWNDFTFFYLPNQLPVFGLGIILYYLIFDKENLKLSSKFLMFTVIVLLIGLCTQGANFIPEIFLYGIVFILLTYSLHKYIPPLLNNNFFIYTGRVSYSFYLTHQAIIHVLSKYKIFNAIIVHNELTAILNFFFNYIIVLFLSLIASTVTYHLIETPMQKLGANLIGFLPKKKILKAL